MSRAHPKAVIFDMDGTLLDTERLYMETFIALGNARGRSDFEAIYLDMVGASDEAAQARLAAILGAEEGVEEFVSDWNAALEVAFEKGISLRPGARDLLEHLSARGYPMAVATSSSTRRANAHLEDAGLLAFLDHVVGSDMVTRRKPDPEPYLLTARLLGAEPADCAVFEDSDIGAIAAVGAGMRTVQVPNLSPPSAEALDLGHHIAPGLIEGARILGLWE